MVKLSFENPILNPAVPSEVNTDEKFMYYI